MRCAKCVDLLAAKDLGKEDYTVALPNIAAFGDANAVRLMLDHGADVNAFDPLGRTPLMYAAASDLLDLDVVKLLVERGADVNAKDSSQAGRRFRTNACSISPGCMATRRWSNG